MPSSVASCGRADRHRLAVEADLTVVRRVDAGDHLDQRRLAGAVVADEPDDLAGVELEVDAVERLDGAEPLADALQREEGSRWRSCGHRLRGDDPRLLAGGRVRPVQICDARQKPSLTTVSLMLPW